MQLIAEGNLWLSRGLSSQSRIVGFGRLPRGLATIHLVTYIEREDLTAAHCTITRVWTTSWRGVESEVDLPPGSSVWGSTVYMENISSIEFSAFAADAIVGADYFVFSC
jgi:hypothetical protein